MTLKPAVQKRPSLYPRIGMSTLVRYMILCLCCGSPAYANDLDGYSEGLDSVDFGYNGFPIKDGGTEELLGRVLAQMEGEEGAARITLQGETIPIALANYPPFLEISKRGRVSQFSRTRGGRGGKVEGRGMSWQLMNTLATYYNFTAVPIVAEEDMIGLKEKNGKWKGALSLIHEQAAELTLMPITVTSNRQEIIDVSILLGTTTFGILVKKPEISPKPDALLKPFSTDVWWLILVATAIMGPLIYFIIVFRVQLCKGDPTLTRIFPFAQCVWFVYGAMMKQGSVLKPISDSSRILFATWWLFIMIVTSFYTANLTAFLTFNGLELPISNVYDLKDIDGVTWLAFRDGALFDIIQTHPKLEVLRQLKKDGRGRFVNDREEALELVRTGEYVYIDDMQVLDYLIQEDFKIQRKKQSNQTCSFYTTPLETQKDFVFWYGYGFKKGSQYQTQFNNFFRRLSFFGILNFLRDNATASGPVCTLPKGFKDRPLQNKDLYTTYVVAAIGIISSCLALVFEYFCRNKEHKQKQQKSTTPVFTITPQTGGGPTQPFQWDENLPPLPDSNPRPPFEARYPQYAGHPYPPVANLDPNAQIVPGKINRTNVIWDQDKGKLIMKDVKELQGNVAYIDGIPYTFLQYETKDGPRVQKMILNDLI